MNIFGIEVQKRKKKRLTIIEKMTIAESTVQLSNTVMHVEMILRVLLAKKFETLGFDYADTDEVEIIYDAVELYKLKNTTKNISLVEYLELKEMALLRYEELNNPIEKMLYMSSKMLEQQAKAAKDNGENV